MKNFKKANLKELKVKSFVTTFNVDESEAVQGGFRSPPVYTDPIKCPPDSEFNVCDEPTAIGASCEFTSCDPAT